MMSGSDVPRRVGDTPPLPRSAFVVQTETVPIPGQSIHGANKLLTQ